MGAIVQMPGGRVCVNELQREARQKLFSYAVAALSNFFWDSLRISRELSIMGRLASPIGPLLCVGERVRTHSDTGRSHKVIGIGSSRCLLIRASDMIPATGQRKRRRAPGAPRPGESPSETAIM
jgi:hypothetical protein